MRKRISSDFRWLSAAITAVASIVVGSFVAAMSTKQILIRMVLIATCISGLVGVYAATASANPVTACINGTPYCYLNGGTVASPATLGGLKKYCNVQIANRTWRLPGYAELQPFVNVLAQRNAPQIPALAQWRAFTAPAAPGYILPTASAQEYTSYTQNSHLYNVSAFEYEVMPSRFVSQLQNKTLMIIGPSADTAPITDGEGGRFRIMVICVANR